LNHEPVAVTYAREKAGLSKAEAARRTGISPALMGEIESGWRNAVPATLKKLAETFNCPVVVLERKRDVGTPQPAVFRGMGAEPGSESVEGAA
jgi:transcriptional regulator with XRE-family HTH domain